MVPNCSDQIRTLVCMAIYVSHRQNMNWKIENMQYGIFEFVFATISIEYETFYPKYVI